MFRLMRPAKGQGARQRPRPHAEIGDGEASLASSSLIVFVARKWARARDASLDRPDKGWSEWEPADGISLPLTRGDFGTSRWPAQARLHQPRDWAEGV